MVNRVFSWKNVPKVLTFFAVCTTAVMVWALANPSLFGEQRWGLVFVCACTGLWWFLIILLGTSKTRVKDVKEPTMRDIPLQVPRKPPEFQDYMQLEEWMEKHPDAIPPNMPPAKGSHHYDAEA